MIADEPQRLLGENFDSICFQKEDVLLAFMSIFTSMSDIDQRIFDVR